MVAHSPRPFALSGFFSKSRSMPQIDELDWLQWYSVDITFSPFLSSSINFFFLFFFFCCLCKPFFYGICLIFKIWCNNEFDAVEWYHKTFFVLLLSNRDMSGSLKENKIRKTEGTIATGHREYKPQSFSHSSKVLQVFLLCKVN